MYLEHTIQFRGKHHVALGLELATHERLLAIELALRELGEGLVGEDDGDVRLLLRLALVDRAGLLEVNRPDPLLALGILYPQLEDAIGLWKHRYMLSMLMPTKRNFMRPTFLI